jgi:hypothetical protein
MPDFSPAFLEKNSASWQRRLDFQIAEPLGKVIHLAAFHQTLLSACPGGMGQGIDFQMHFVAGLAPGRPRRRDGTVRPFDGNIMVIRMNAFFHFFSASVKNSPPYRGRIPEKQEVKITKY